MSESADGVTVKLEKGARLMVELEANPTTGFDWRLTDVPPKQLAAGSDTFETTAATGVAGAGGHRVFAYTAAEVGTGVLDLEYVRAWERGIAPQRTFSLTVVVK